AVCSLTERASASLCLCGFLYLARLGARPSGPRVRSGVLGRAHPGAARPSSLRTTPPMEGILAGVLHPHPVSSTLSGVAMKCIWHRCHKQIEGKLATHLARFVQGTSRELTDDHLSLSDPP